MFIFQLLALIKSTERLVLFLLASNRFEYVLAMTPTKNESVNVLPVVPLTPTGVVSSKVSTIELKTHVKLIIPPDMLDIPSL